MREARYEDWRAAGRLCYEAFATLADEHRRVGRKLMEAMFTRAKEVGAPGVRLLQLAYHNRSLSLYAKLGMDVRGSFAAMHGDPVHLAVPGYEVRPATLGLYQEPQGAYMPSVGY